jgi:hypothetical protein
MVRPTDRHPDRDCQGLLRSHGRRSSERRHVQGQYRTGGSTPTLNPASCYIVSNDLPKIETLKRIFPDRWVATEDIKLVRSAQ